MENLRLTYPSQQEGQHILVETDPGALRQWLSGLPMGDMGKTLPEVTRALASLNRTELSASHRTELMTHFDYIYALVHDYFRPKVNKSGKQQFVSSEEHQQLQLFTREMSFAHKIIVDDNIAKRKLWGKARLLARSINLAIHYLGLMLVEQYETYAPIPIHIWREINSLFAYAEKHKADHIEAFGDEGYFHCLDTVQQSYLRCCLMALADPYHLDRGEHWQLFKYLDRWCGLAEISEDPDDFSREECFLIDVTSQHKPNFVTKELEDPDDPRIRLLLTKDLIRQIKYDLENLEDKGEVPAEGFYQDVRPATATYLLTHAQKHWRKRVERRHRRYPIFTRVDLVWGLPAIYRLLQLTQTRSGNKAVTRDEIEAILGDGQAAAFEWDASNVSTGGIGLVHRDYIVSKIKLGDAVIIREYVDGQPAPHWRLGLCRWLNGDKHKGTQVGLEFIAGRIQAVKLLLKQGSNLSGGQAALQISEGQVDGRKGTTLLTTRGTFQEGRSFVLQTLRETTELRPRARVQVTPCVERFFYQSFEMEGRLPEPREESDGNEVLPWTAVPHERGNIDDEIKTDNKDGFIDLDNVRLPGDH